MSQPHIRWLTGRNSLALCDRDNLRQTLIRLNVRFGSKANSCSAATHVRFTPDSDRESGHPRTERAYLSPRGVNLPGSRGGKRPGANGAKST